MKHAQSIGTEKIPLDEAYGRILAEPIIAKHDVPPFDRSPYDGFAVRAQDTVGASGDNRIAVYSYRRNWSRLCCE